MSLGAFIYINPRIQNWLNLAQPGEQATARTQLRSSPPPSTSRSLYDQSKVLVQWLNLQLQTRFTERLGNKALKEHISHTREVLVDTVWSSHAAAVAAIVSTFNYSLKTKKEAIKKQTPISDKPLNKQPGQLSIKKADGKHIGLDWSTGLVFGQAQNLARELMETPANLMTPTLFCERIKKEFQRMKNVFKVFIT
ncbi:hypothetical protein PCANC_27344 [Puccinia coronata f. sp. avenae]|uniref:Uncharacterized protein n=1 Tax=Puccinia coronata f. sp. avenae TaxID=200324 RepID=A0A2N5TK57_9BASI|nr:hypothetical protein PCANC_27344 [Puccinia coronata f. sp. avenae]